MRSRRVRLLTKSEETDLFADIRVGNTAAIETIAIAYMPLVAATARSFYHKYADIVEEEDLVGVGCEALLIALSRFDHSKGHRFSGYARMFIVGHMKHFIRDERWRMPQIPDSVHRRLMALLRAQREMRQTLGREPFAMELADELKLTIHQTNRLLAWLSRDALISLSTPIGDGDSSLADVIEDRRAVTPFEALEANRNLRMRQAISDVLATLSPRQAEIIKSRFGLGWIDAGEYLGHIGRRLALSTEQIRRIVDRTIQTLRGPTGARLRDFLPKGRHDE